MRHLFGAVLIGLGVAGGVAAQTPDASGTWAVRLNAPDGPHEATLTLARNGEALTGAIKGPEGEYAIKGTQKGVDVSLSFTYTGDGVTLITLKGTVGGDTIGGIATFGDATGDWSGKRAAAAAARRPPAVPINFARQSNDGGILSDGRP